MPDLLRRSPCRDHRDPRRANPAARRGVRVYRTVPEGRDGHGGRTGDRAREQGRGRGPVAVAAPGWCPRPPRPRRARPRAERYLTGAGAAKSSAHIYRLVDDAGRDARPAHPRRPDPLAGARSHPSSPLLLLLPPPPPPPPPPPRSTTRHCRRSWPSWRRHGRTRRTPPHLNPSRSGLQDHPVAPLTRISVTPHVRLLATGSAGGPLAGEAAEAPGVPLVDLGT